MKFDAPESLYELSGADKEAGKAVNVRDAREAFIAREEKAAYDRAKRKHEEYVNAANEEDGFYTGDGQWKQKDIDRLKKEGRPALTINKVLSTVNTITGEQLARRMDVVYKSRTEGADDAAYARTKLAQMILDANQYHWLESEVFEDGVVMRRGYFDIRMNWDENPAGDAEIRQLDPRMVIPDPNMKSYDPKDWSEVTTLEWLSLEDIATTYGEEKAQKIEHLVRASAVKDMANFDFDLPQKPDNDDVGSFTADTDEQLKRLRTVLVRQRQFYQHVRVFCVYDPQTGESRTLPPKIKADEARAIGERLGLPVMDKVQRRVRWRVVADDVLLHDSWSPYETFTVIPYFCYFRHGKTFGVVTNLRSPQELLNKLSSQELHIVNSTANSGWKVPKGALTNMTVDELAQQGSKTGLVLEFNALKGEPEKIQPNHIPTGLDRISGKAEGHIKEISGVTDALLGLESPEVSGIALRGKEKRGQVMIQKPLDNLDRTRYLVARKLRELMVTFYNDTRTIALTRSTMPGGPVEYHTINQIDWDGVVRNDIGFGEDDIVISSIPNRDTQDDTQFAHVLEMRAQGIPIPGYRAVQVSPLANREEIAQEVQAMEGLAPPSEQEQQLAQMQQELAMRTAMAELAKLEGEVAELESKVQLNYAKAEQLTSEERRELRDLEATLAMKREELDLRQRLAALSQVGKLEAIKAQGRVNLLNNLVNQNDHTGVNNGGK